MSDIFPAATVVLVRDGGNGLEVLLLRRSKEVAFAGGAWVFPGGRIDNEDYLNNSNDKTKAAFVAAVREAREEAGLVLNIDNLHYFAHWTAPPQTSKRFATWFFISAISNNHNVTVDGSEIDQYRWYKPVDAIDEMNNKRIRMMPPTFVTLTELCQFSSAESAIETYAAREAMQFKPKIVRSGDSVCALYWGDAGYESNDIVAAGPDRHRLWMLDSGWSYENNLQGR